jgi:hypothetical protein
MMMSDGNNIIDLSWVTQAKDAPEKRVYLCPLCPAPDSILIRQLDPESMSFEDLNISQLF